jgi:N-acetylglucosaminyldiphosphoundecaprenol N-acetyl-beta-D-mannosaminyltransferase
MIQEKGDMVENCTADDFKVNKANITYKSGYKRRADKREIPVCKILGVNIAAINMEWLLNYLKSNIKSKKGNRLAGEYICVSNVHTTVMSYENASYCSVQNGGLMALPDGGPLSRIGRKRGYKNMERISGPSLMGEIFQRSAACGYSHYLYGSKAEILEKMRLSLEKAYPGIKILGMYSPPFKTLSKEEDETVISSINEVKPDFIWVGLGAPKQEVWMAEHFGKVNGLMIGVGAGFDIYSGNMKRAPGWMQNNNLEWLFRLIQEPKRLFKRYLTTNLKFIFLLIARRV